MSDKTLYDRLGGYDAIAAFAENIIPRFRQDELLALLTIFVLRRVAQCFIQVVIWSQPTEA